MPLRCDVVCPIPGGTVPSGIGMENTVRKTILAALSATLVLAAPVAHADTRDLEDPLGDVMTATLQDNWEFKYNREHGAEGDIVFARIQHTAKQVIVYLRYAQLTVPKQRFAYYSYQFEGTNDARVGVGIQTRQRKPQGGSYAYSSVRRKCVVAHHALAAHAAVSIGTTLRLALARLDPDPNPRVVCPLELVAVVGEPLLRDGELGVSQVDDHLLGRVLDPGEDDVALGAVLAVVLELPVVLQGRCHHVTEGVLEVASVRVCHRGRQDQGR